MRLGRPPKAPKVDRQCEVCGKCWQAYAWENSGEVQKYCSRVCWAKSRIGKGHPRVTPENRSCAECGKAFFVRGAGNKPARSRFCCKQCALNGRWVGRPGHQRPREMSDADASWFAGVFDGEGSVVWPRKEFLQTVRLSITNTSYPLLAEVARVVGTGKIRNVSKYRKNPRHSRTWVWDCHGENARRLLSQIVARLIVKREAAEIALGIRHAKRPPLSPRTKLMRAAQKAEARME